MPNHKITPPPFIVNSKLGQKIIALRNGNSRLFIAITILLVLGLVGGGIAIVQAITGSGNGMTFSGTIEATIVHLGTETGGKVDKVTVKEGDTVYEGQLLVAIRGERVRSPINGVVLDRSIEPGEIALPGSTLMTVTNLDDLKLTVYVPEDRYGQIILGQVCDVKVDSFPGTVFKGKVSHIADQAEFTPRNVQTVDSRKNTVYAIQLDLPATSGKLKPGMPADVNCQLNKE